ncbi:MAG: SH3 domain-containing protein [Ardenticatenaceae bacterium]|nr:SH3 domain-containing protein [Ardenticatenaceae bacterium]MCB9443152.1 SH3 domain-containing protein [Ardenticatenaceae bacterium]
MKGRRALILMVGLLILTSLACSQAGEILSPAEATARAVEAIPVFTTGSSSVEGGVFEAGDTAVLTGRSFLVNLYDNPGGKVSAGQERGAEVTVLEASTEGDEVWYKIEAGTGEGWVPATSLEAPEGEAAATIEGPQPGDGVYLQGRSFLVNFLDVPNGKIIAGQERGMAVTILQVAEVDGTVWYQIDAPAGQGWVPAENITTEAP